MSAATQRLSASILLALLAACAEAPPHRTALYVPPPAPVVRPPQLIMDGPPAPETIPKDIEKIPDAIPKQEPRSLSGNPDSYEVAGETFQVMPTSHGYHMRGMASWYGTKFHGRTTASGEPYDMFAMTAAHKTLPIPTYLKVTNLNNRRSVVVRVNDRGPFHPGRLLDLSYAAAAKLDMLGCGAAPVEVSSVEPISGDAVAAGGRYLQAGAFTDPVDAVMRRQAIVALGIPQVQLASEQSGTRYVHRVFVGPFSDDATLKQTRLTLDNANIGYETIQR